MKTLTQTLSIATCALIFVGCRHVERGGAQPDQTARAGEDVTGTWKGQFDSQIGLQKYTYEFKVAGTDLTGKAIGEREMGTNEVVITEGTVTTNGIYFVEPLKLGDFDLRIEYTGKVSGDEIKFHRKVGEYAEEDFTAKRVKEAVPPEAKPEAEAGTNAPPAKP
jgi:hypothetical protein